VPAGSPAGPCWFTGRVLTDSRAGRQAGLQASWFAGKLVCRQVGLQAGWLAGRLACRQVGLQAAEQAGWQIGRRIGMPAGWKVWI
jgi:hypothetical protein